MNPENAVSRLSPGMAECHARLMAVAKHGTPEAFSATLAGVLQRAELSISNAYDAGAKSIQVDAAAAPNATTEFIKAFREYLTVHPNIKLGGHEADTVARELALIAQPAVATEGHPMTSPTQGEHAQPEALRLADWLEAVGGGPSAKRCAALLCEQHARIAELEAQLEAIGAGGVSGPLIGRASLQSPGFDAADMATASAQGFRDGVASLSANAREPVAMYSIDADPQGIRSTVAEAITGALAFGALGVNQPPEGHWLAPFWKAAREDKEAVRVKRDLRQELQQQCSTWGAYWRGSDAHGVVISHPQAVELLQIALGVEVEIEIRGCQTCDYTGVIGDMPCPDCAAPPTAQAEGWISVAERLPATYATVLLTIDGKHITTGEYIRSLSCFSWDTHDDETDDSRVTHWMPLPPPPTSAEGVEHG